MHLKLLLSVELCRGVDMWSSTSLPYRMQCVMHTWWTHGWCIVIATHTQPAIYNHAKVLLCHSTNYVGLLRLAQIILENVYHWGWELALLSTCTPCIWCSTCNCCSTNLWKLYAQHEHDNKLGFNSYIGDQPWWHHNMSTAVSFVGS